MFLPLRLSAINDLVFLADVVKMCENCGLSISEQISLKKSTGGQEKMLRVMGVHLCSVSEARLDLEIGRPN